MELIRGMELASRIEEQVQKFGTEIIFKELSRLDRVADGSFVLSLGDGKQLMRELW